MNYVTVAYGVVSSGGAGLIYMAATTSNTVTINYCTISNIQTTGNGGLIQS